MKNILKIAFLTLNSASLLASDTNNLIQVEQALQGLGRTYDYLTSHDFTAKKKALTPSPPIPPAVSTPVTGPVVSADATFNLVDLEQALKAKGYDYGAMLVMNLATKIDVLNPTLSTAGINLSFGFNENKGTYRPSMEDAHEATVNSPTSGFFGIYDGHGGAQVAFYLAAHLYRNIKTQPNFSTDPVQAIINGSLQTNQKLKNSEELGEAYKDKAKRNNAKPMKEIASHTGSTATFAVIEGNQLYVGNAGDARTVISTNGIAKALSVDHKPDREDEKKRVQDLGGAVIWDGVWRVMSRTSSTMLAISRAFGDFDLSPYVIATPEVQQYTITDADDFLILACDGVWDVFSDQQAVDLVKAKLAEYDPRDLDSEALNSVAKGLVDGALAAGSKDNVSAIVVKFR